MALSPPLHLPLSSPSLRRLPRLHLSPHSLPRRPRPPSLVRLDEAASHGFHAAVEELERAARDPSDVLGGMVEDLSARDLQLVLVYFAQEGRDSYCALEVFDWLRRENRLDMETRELMVSIACGWIERMVEEEGRTVGDVAGLLDEIEYVGLEVGFSLEEKVVSLYWERGRREEAVEFVRDAVRRGRGAGEGEEEGRGGILGYLVWKMMVDGKYMDAVKLVMDFKECGLNPEIYSYLITLTALVKEQKDFSKNLRSLRASIKKGLLAELGEETVRLIQNHQSDILEKGTLLSKWALQEGSSAVRAIVHERLLALYTCAGCGLEAERQLWEIMLAGKEPDRELYNIVLAICASQNEDGSVQRLLSGIDGTSAGSRRKALQWLVRGYVKGGHYTKASEALLKMLDMGLCPEYLDRAAVMQGLRKSIKQSGNPEPYLKLCKRLSDLDLIGPCIMYLHVGAHKLWVLKAI